MKKLIAIVFTAVLLAAGLVVATSGTASANCTPSQYSGCVVTRTKVKAPATVPKNRRATICATVRAKGSNATPTGVVKFKVTRNKGGYFFKKVVPYGGGQVCVKTTRLKRVGGYTAVAKFKSPAGSIFINSRDSVGFVVVR